MGITEADREDGGGERDAAGLGEMVAVALSELPARVPSPEVQAPVFGDEGGGEGPAGDFRDLEGGRDGDGRRSGLVSSRAELIVIIYSPTEERAAGGEDEGVVHTTGDGGDGTL
jgi:hypothetical protein